MKQVAIGMRKHAPLPFHNIPEKIEMGSSVDENERRSHDEGERQG